MEDGTRRRKMIALGIAVITLLIISAVVTILTHAAMFKCVMGRGGRMQRDRPLNNRHWNVPEGRW